VEEEELMEFLEDINDGILKSIFKSHEDLLNHWKASRVLRFSQDSWMGLALMLQVKVPKGIKRGFQGTL
jgi:hypothetical protein